MDRASTRDPVHLLARRWYIPDTGVPQIGAEITPANLIWVMPA
jgi:hypothetical protein